MEEEVSLPTVMLASRPGKLRSMSIVYTQSYDRGDVVYTFGIRDAGDTFEVALHARLLQGGNSYREQDRLSLPEHRRLTRDLGSLLFHDLPQTLHAVATTLAAAFPSNHGPYTWQVHPIHPDEPTGTATLTIRDCARKFSEGLELFVNNLDMPGHRTITATYDKA
jgi:hypothetical protein